MINARRIATKVAYIEKELLELDGLLNGRFNCPQCALSLPRIFAKHLAAAHGIKITHRIDAFLKPRSELMEDDAVQDVDVDLTLSKLVNWDDKETEKRNILKIVSVLEKGLPELSLESQLELQHEDEEAPAVVLDDEVSKSLTVMEKFVEEVNEFYTDCEERDWIFIPEDEVGESMSAREEDDALAWFDFVQKTQQSIKNQRLTDPKIRKRMIPLKERYTCEVCNLKFSKRSILLRHVLQHAKEGIFRCSRCCSLAEMQPGKDECDSCRVERRMDRQMIETFNETEGFVMSRLPRRRKYYARFPCAMCGRKFPSKPSLMLHEETHTTGRVVYECERCKAVYPSAEDRDIHQQVHEGEVDFYCCQLCKKQFSKRANYLRHVDIHNGVRYSCKQCNRSYTQEYQLKCHERKHSGEPKFRCKVCNRTFAEPSSYCRHKKIHEVTSRRLPTEHSENAFDPLAEAVQDIITPINTKSDSLKKQLFYQRLNMHKRKSNEVEVILCKAVENGTGRPTLVANAFKAEPTGIPGYTSLTNSVLVEGSGSSPRGFSETVLEPMTLKMRPKTRLFPSLLA
ncbi:unnamed protein product [Notodromas monacha]|uniref:C2H2-type domain-containing protein n=1 Tax=Notodromas monacha TaxID=399045 RepID=A0A7R9BFE6_9CRUS|nr:unnamed protein product [Notodromas monacha]CAG0914414.1 unnamed protein product [Notodromas monacha]